MDINDTKGEKKRKKMCPPTTPCANIRRGSEEKRAEECPVSPSRTGGTTAKKGGLYLERKKESWRQETEP